ncbi:MAG: hypothetical protein ACI8QC_002764 [Planctomycetota bacterium]|jgi:hypothetical protein
MTSLLEDASRSDQAGQRRKFGPRARLLITLLAVPLGLLLVEASLRLRDVHVQPLAELKGAVTERVDDALMLYENRADGRGVVVGRDPLGGRPTRVVMTTNADRFRGPLVPQERTAGLPRVVCLGDSHTFGYAVPDGESWPAHLRGMVSAPVEVINAGVTAYDTLQEVLWFERRVDAFEPDVVVLQYFMNDTAARGLAHASADPLVTLTHPRREGRVRWLRERWRTLDLVCDAVFRSRSQRNYATDRTAQHQDGQPGWKRVKSALLRLRDHCAARERTFLIVLYPYLIEEEGGFASDEAFAVVRSFCEAEGITCIDSTVALLEAGGGQLRVSEVDYHANGIANRVFAGVVARGLAQAGLPFIGDASE